MNPNKAHLIKTELDSMLKLGVIEPSNSPVSEGSPFWRTPSAHSWNPAGMWCCVNLMYHTMSTNDRVDQQRHDGKYGQDSRRWWRYNSRRLNSRSSNTFSLQVLNTGNSYSHCINKQDRHWTVIHIVLDKQATCSNYNQCTCQWNGLSYDLLSSLPNPADRLMASSSNSYMLSGSPTLRGSHSVHAHVLADGRRRSLPACE